jgi:hypothetical protein
MSAGSMMFYVYEHLRLDTGACFYVGKGSNGRCKTHAGRNSWWRSIVAKHGFEYKIRLTTESEELAFLAEQELIDQHRKLGHTLVNMTDGGEGMSGYKMPPEIVEKRAAKLRGVKRPDISARMKGMPKSEAHRKALSKAKTGTRASDETRRKLSLASKGRVSSMLGKTHKPESKRKISEAIKGDKNPFFGKTHTPEVMAKIMAANVGRTDSDETRAKKSLARLADKNPRYGVSLSQDQIERQRASLMARPKVTCPHCALVLDESNAKRWHFDNCKHKG